MFWAHTVRRILDSKRIHQRLKARILADLTIPAETAYYDAWVLYEVASARFRQQIPKREHEHRSSGLE